MVLNLFKFVDPAMRTEGKERSREEADERGERGRRHDASLPAIGRRRALLRLAKLCDEVHELLRLLGVHCGGPSQEGVVRRTGRADEPQ